ncbi:MAG: polysaccharide pyruvyl transferase family protein [Lachnospiraceae bacterium]|nr:polysaccharide pyruvyl transferase family protein [Lachnospiraceae bacterium]
MIIGLLGFPFSDSNKGCEALTYSFIYELNKVYKKDLTIINLWGKDVGYIKESFPGINIYGVEFSKRDFTFSAIKALKKCDYVFDCTFGDNFSDIYSLQFVKKTTFFKELVLKMRIPLILAPQTIGPFSDRSIKKRAINILNKCTLVFTRDQLSSNYVKEISKATPVTVTDLAFLLPYNTENYSFSNIKKVGLNVSGLLWIGGFTKDNQFGLTIDYKEFVKDVICLFQSMDYEIHLIPHVIATDQLNHDDDVEICKKLAEEFSLILAPAFNNPIDAKSYIYNMNLFIGARMHSTVAGFSSGVPTIPISYSRKCDGLYNSVSYPYVINAKKESNKTAINKIVEYVSNIDAVKSQQKLALARIAELENVFENKIRKLLLGSE